MCRKSLGLRIVFALSLLLGEQVSSKNLYKSGEIRGDFPEGCEHLECKKGEECVNRKFWCKNPSCPSMLYCSSNRKESLKGPATCDTVRCSKGYVCLVRVRHCRWDRICKQQTARCVPEREYYEGPATCADFRCPDGHECILRESLCVKPPCKLLKSCASVEDVRNWYERCRQLGCPSEYECFLRKPPSNCSQPPCKRTPDCTRTNDDTEDTTDENCRGWMCPRMQECLASVQEPCKSDNCAITRSCHGPLISSASSSGAISPSRGTLWNANDEAPSITVVATDPIPTTIESTKIIETARTPASVSDAPLEAGNLEENPTADKGVDPRKDLQVPNPRMADDVPIYKSAVYVAPTKILPSTPPIQPVHRPGLSSFSDELNYLRLKTGIDAINAWVKISRDDRYYPQFEEWLGTVKNILGPEGFEVWAGEVRSITAKSPEFQNWLNRLFHGSSSLPRRFLKEPLAETLPFKGDENNTENWKNVEENRPNATVISSAENSPFNSSSVTEDRANLTGNPWPLNRFDNWWRIEENWLQAYKNLLQSTDYAGFPVIQVHGGPPYLNPSSTVRRSEWSAFDQRFLDALRMRYLRDLTFSPMSPGYAIGNPSVNVPPFLKRIVSAGPRYYAWPYQGIPRAPYRYFAKGPSNLFRQTQLPMWSHRNPVHRLRPMPMARRPSLFAPGQSVAFPWHGSARYHPLAMWYRPPASRLPESTSSSSGKRTDSTISTTITTTSTKKPPVRNRVRNDSRKLFRDSVGGPSPAELAWVNPNRSIGHRQRSRGKGDEPKKPGDEYPRRRKGEPRPEKTPIRGNVRRKETAANGGNRTGMTRVGSLPSPPYLEDIIEIDQVPRVLKLRDKEKFLEPNEIRFRLEWTTENPEETGQSTTVAGREIVSSDEPLVYEDTARSSYDDNYENAYDYERNVKSTDSSAIDYIEFPYPGEIFNDAPDGPLTTENSTGGAKARAAPEEEANEAAIPSYEERIGYDEDDEDQEERNGRIELSEGSKSTDEEIVFEDLPFGGSLDFLENLKMMTNDGENDAVTDWKSTSNEEGSYYYEAAER